jgi:hypothetical protein
MEGNMLFRFLGWAIAGLILLVAMGMAFVWFVVPKAAKDEFKVAHGLEEGIPERHILPEGFQGWMVVEYEIPGTPELPIEDGVFVFRHPESGTLETASRFSPGMKRKEYFTHGPTGREALAELGPKRRIWGQYDLSHVIEEDGEVERRDRQSGFFVGTREEYKEAKLRAPHLPPGIPLGDELQ